MADFKFIKTGSESLRIQIDEIDKQKVLKTTVLGTKKGYHLRLSFSKWC